MSLVIEASGLPPWSLVALVFGVAFLYASVGFGGASGYLAAMSLFSISTRLMGSTALALNILVASVAFLAFYRARHFRPQLLWPFLLTSIPAAFLGGVLPVGTVTYQALLYLTLSYVALRLLLYNGPADPWPEGGRSLPWTVALVSGALIGLLSGVLGVGGGIFLSPLIVLAGWGTPRQAAASAAGFIAVNSVSGLVGRLVGGNLELGLLGLTLLPVGLIGALGGSHLGARYLSGPTSRRVLGIVLLLAVLRFWLRFLGIG